jgi:hypothetical protein
MPVLDLSSYEVADAEESDHNKFNNMLGAVETVVNGLDEANFAVGALAVNRLEPGTNGQVLTTTGGAAAWAAGGFPVVYDRVTTNVDVVSTTTLTPWYTKTIAAGDLSTNKALRLRIGFDALMATGSAGFSGLRIQVLFGATTLWDASSPGVFPINAARRAGVLELVLQADGATNAQILTGVFLMGPAGAPTTGTGAFGNANDGTVVPFGGTAAEDSTAAKDLVVKVAPLHNAANESWRLLHATAVLL